MASTSTTTTTTMTNDNTNEEETRKAKRHKRQKKKMSKILTSIWGLDHSKHFQKVSDSDFDTSSPSTSSESGPFDLTTIGQNLEHDSYAERKKGWIFFAKDLGGVYRRFIDRGVKTKIAKGHLQEVGSLLSAIDPKLTDVALETPIADNGDDDAAASAPTSTSTPATEPASPELPKKRKPSISVDNNSVDDTNEILFVPKKRKKNDMLNGACTSGEENLTLTQQEDKAMDNLIAYIEKCGGQREQCYSFRCQINQTPMDRTTIIYISSQGRRHRSMADVARFLSLYPPEKGKHQKDSNTPPRTTPAVKSKSRHPRNNRELEAERKKLKKELDRLLKAHIKATKTLDDFRNERRDDQTPIDDRWLLDPDDPGQEKNAGEGQEGDSSTSTTHLLTMEERAHRFTVSLVNQSDVCADHSSSSFPGLPEECTPDVLMAWDFLCTFGRALSLEPIGLDQFVAALTYRPPKPPSARPQDEEEEVGVFTDDPPIVTPSPSPPLYLAEAHLALLKLLLSDPSSDDWWWSTLETAETEAVETTGQKRSSIAGGSIFSGGGGLSGGGGGYFGATGGGKNSSGGGEDADNPKPTIKVDDIGSLLSSHWEDPSTTKKWLQALEDVRSRRTNSGNAVKSSVKSAISITSNPLVKTYLRKAMKKWTVTAAGTTKAAVEWLVVRIREARPDLWGRSVSPEVMAEQKVRVLREAVIGMEELEDEPEMVDGMEEVLHDEEEDGESEEDEDSDSDEDEHNNDNNSSPENKQRNNDATNQDDAKNHSNEDAQVNTAIPTNPPPSLIDLLLPPGKPLPRSDLVSPFTWPFIAGASACRIVHRYRRLRNEVDDGLREFRDIGPMKIIERRRREKAAASRFFSECFSAATVDDENKDDKSCLVESAIRHLCGEGKDYLSLTPIHRLCILRTLIEAAYDTHHIHQCIQDNIKSSIGAMKQLENEKRKVKKETRVEAADSESEARERLAREAREDFLTKRRREIARENSENQDHMDAADAEDEEDILENLNEETRAEYEALLTPQQFNKSEVNSMVAKINEAAVFDTTSLEVLSLDEIQTREANELASMEEELASYGNVDIVYQDRETSAKVDQLKREIDSYKEWLVTLPPSRAEAIDALRDGMEDGTIKVLRSAIKSAKLALLTGEHGDDDDNEGKWVLNLLRDAVLELKAAEKRKRVSEAQRDLVIKKNKCFVRTEQVGTDRAYNAYWKFDQDESSHIWRESDYRINRACPQSVGEDCLSIDADMAIIGAEDEEEDILQRDASGSVQKNSSFLKFSRQEYHPSGLFPKLVKRHHGCLSAIDSLRSLVKVLDGRGVREGPLKATMKEVLEGRLAAPSLEAVSMEKMKSIDGDEQSQGGKGLMSSSPSPAAETCDINDVDDTSPRFEKEGDKAAFQQAKIDASSFLESVNDTSIGNILSSITSAIGQRVRLRTLIDPVIAPDAADYSMGTITGWTARKGKLMQQENEDATAMEEQLTNNTTSNIWCLALDNGGERELTSSNLIDCLVRSQRWKNQQDGYCEDDDLKLFAYRNKLGRFCGRAADAPDAASASSLSRLVLKREQELYVPMKNRAYDNTWGGKSGARNAWIASMKDYAYDFDAIRDGLLTLENAFFELCGADCDQGEEESLEASVPREAEDLLMDTKHRFDIELESIENREGLWNSQEARRIYRFMVSSCTSLGFLALCLDLLCRNCQAFLHRNKPTMTRNSCDPALYATGTGRVTRSSYEQPLGQQQPTRRMNAWQQQNGYY